MRTYSLIFALIAASAAPVYAPAQQSGASPSNDKLLAVLQRMDKTAAGFRAAEATFEWDQYQRVVDSTDKQSGKVYFRRAGGNTQMLAEVAQPAPPKYVLYSGGKVQLYQPNIDHLDIYSTGENRAAVESFLVLGFGGTSRDLLKSFNVNYGGEETLDGVNTDKLELIPKADRVRSMFKEIELWINAEGISVQQKLISPEGDYRLAKYTNIALKSKIGDNVFKLKISGKTVTETH